MIQCDGNIPRVGHVQFHAPLGHFAPLMIRLNCQENDALRFQVRIWKRSDIIKMAKFVYAMKIVYLTRYAFNSYLIKVAFLSLKCNCTCIFKRDNFKCEKAGPNFMALLTAQFCACDHHSPLTGHTPDLRVSSKANAQ